MEVRGLTQAQLDAIAGGLSLDFANFRSVGGRGFGFRLVPLSSRGKYARRSPPTSYNPNGRRLVATCYHGFRDAIMRFFDAGATSVRTAGPVGRVSYHSADEFAGDLDAYLRANMGTMMEPASVLELCECVECEVCGQVTTPADASYSGNTGAMLTRCGKCRERVRIWPASTTFACIDCGTLDSTGGIVALRSDGEWRCALCEDGDPECAVPASEVCRNCGAAANEFTVVTRDNSGVWRCQPCAYDADLDANGIPHQDDWEDCPNCGREHTFGPDGCAGCSFANVCDGCGHSAAVAGPIRFTSAGWERFCFNCYPDDTPAAPASGPVCVTCGVADSELNHVYRQLGGQWLCGRCDDDARRLMLHSAAEMVDRFIRAGRSVS